MIVYGDRCEIVEPRRRLSELQEGVARAAGGAGGHEAVVELLIGFGEVEAGIVDALCSEVEHPQPLAQLLRVAAIRFGHALGASWRGDPAARRAWLERAGELLDALEGEVLPDRIRVGVPEGYAYYALYPEAYLEAAAEFAREVGRGEVVCIGVRSIGTGLSAVVVAELERAGYAVRSKTVRPRGHPFDRKLACSAEFEREVRGAGEGHFAVVDEGPGLSGSSLACVAEWLSAIGVRDDRIVLFPSWRTDGSTLRSALARARWPRHRQYTVSFEILWLESGRLAEGVGASRLVDLSAGEWRTHVYRDEARYPAVQPHHERRKYLALPARPPARSTALPENAAPAAPKDDPLLLKFVGLGRYGRARLALAEGLAEVGFSPRPLGISNGFLISRFIEGRPLEAGAPSRTLLETLSRYLAHRSMAYPSPRSVPFDEVLHMIHTNCVEGLGDGWSSRLDFLETSRGAVLDRTTVAIDGRMLPHEWLGTANGYRKVDAVDHHDDHFFPGCQDIAWDLAGAAVEFGLGEREQRLLVEHYAAVSGDRGVDRVLPFYRVAYLAFRLGYTTLGAEAVGAGNEQMRLGRAARRYRALLRREIGRRSR